MITVKNLTKIYNPNKQVQCQALMNVDMNIKDGDLIAIVGPSGAGKSTLLHILACIDRPTEGNVEIDGIDICKLSESKLAHMRNSVTSIVLQDFALLDDFTVFDNVFMPLCFAKGSMQLKKRKVSSILNVLHIEDLAKKQINQLSGGQKQRVAIARALVTSPKYIFADEPTGALDSKTSNEIMDVLLELNKQNITVIIVTHNMEIANRCKRIIAIKDGKATELMDDVMY